MERITRSDVNGAIDILNGILENSGSFYRIALNHRYDYFVIEQFNHDDMAKYGYRKFRHEPLTSGTMRDCNAYVRAMIKGIEINTYKDSGFYRD